MAFLDEDEVTGDRLSALEKFAGTSEGAMRRGELVEHRTGEMFQGVERVWGAQKVAVYRDESKIIERLKAAAAVAGEAWYYRWPVRNQDGTTGWVEGPSIKLTDELIRVFGNCELLSRSVDLGDSWLFASRFTDLETGYIRERTFQQRKSQRTSNKMDPARALDVAYQIGQSKSERNVVVHALQALTNACFQEAKASLVSKIGENLPLWVERIIKALMSQGIDVRRVEKKLGREKEKWLAPDVAGIVATMKTIKDSMATWDETYPPLEASTATAGTGEKVDGETGEITVGEPAIERDALDDLAGGDGSGSAGTQRTAEPAAGGHPGGTQTATKESRAAGDSPATSNTPPKKPPAPSVAATASVDDSAFTPTNEAQYVTYFNTWFANTDQPSEALKRWNGEKKLRNACKVSEPTRERLKEIVQTKVLGT